MSQHLFSSAEELNNLSKLIRGYLCLPFAGGLLPGSFIEKAIARTRDATVLSTYDFVDVLKAEAGIGWQVKCTKESTPVTWKRAKIPNGAALIEDAQQSDEKTQELGQAILDFCNQHAYDSLERYHIDAIGYCRVIVRSNDILYFEREIMSRSDPQVFRPVEFRWEWSETRTSSGKELLPALNGVNKLTGKKWFAAHVLGENQLHFSGERAWWPDAGDSQSSRVISLPSESDYIGWNDLLAWLDDRLEN